MFGFKQQHKLITFEGMEMIKRQIECDNHNILMASIIQKDDNKYKKINAYMNNTLKSIRQQEYALKKGRFR